jgi:hypothetical protein
MTFKRNLSDTRMEQLSSMVSASENNWWKDLLALWQPAGYPCDPEVRCLRLAIRNNYLSFYYGGQSIAKVAFGPKNIPYLSVHEKYVIHDAEGKRYFSLLKNEKLIQHKMDGRTPEYKGIDTIKSFIDNAKKYTGTEKIFVDAIISENKNIIDMEMAINVFDTNRAQRIDLVNLEPYRDSSRLSFLEVKMINNPGLVSSSDVIPVEKKQLEPYSTYIRKNEDAIKAAHVIACAVLTKLHKMAKLVDQNIPDLGPLIEATGKSVNSLEIDSAVRLVISSDAKQGSNWPKHLSKFKKKPQIMNAETKYVLKPLENF